MSAWLENSSPGWVIEEGACRIGGGVELLCRKCRAVNNRFRLGPLNMRSAFGDGEGNKQIGWQIVKSIQWGKGRKERVTAWLQ